MSKLGQGLFYIYIYIYSVYSFRRDTQCSILFVLYGWSKRRGEGGRKKGEKSDLSFDDAGIRFVSRGYVCNPKATFALRELLVTYVRRHNEKGGNLLGRAVATAATHSLPPTPVPQYNTGNPRFCCC